MQEFKFLVLEDDISFFLDIKMILDELGYYDIYHYDNAEAAIKVLEKRDVDLMILDINLKGKMTGVDFAKSIKNQTPFVFISSNDSDVYPEISTLPNCLGYLNKPITKTSLKTSLDLSIKNINQNVVQTKLNESSLFLKKKEVYKKVLIHDISHIEAEGGYSLVHAKDEVFLTNMGLNEFESFLDKSLFYRIHRGHIVNFSMIEGVNPSENSVIVHNSSIPISRNNRKIVFDQINRIS